MIYRSSFTLPSILIAGLITLSAFLPERAYAQADMGSENINNMIRGNAAIITPRATRSEIVGSLYFYEFFTPGTIFLNNGQKLTEIQARYNVLEDRLEIINRADTLQLSEVLVRGFELEVPSNESVYHFRNRVGSVANNFSRNSYLQVLFESEDELTGVYVRHSKRLAEPRTSGASGYGINERAYRIENSTTVLFKGEDSQLTPVRLNRRNVLRVFGDKSNQVRDYARSNNLNFRDKNDFVKMVQFYTSL
ncbi:MAG: hypothetical protein LAT67_07360 [Balneolales bacterium]|nr:hypothetical protein [Balneolales bacterium]